MFISLNNNRVIAAQTQFDSIFDPTGHWTPLQFRSRHLWVNGKIRRGKTISQKNSSYDKLILKKEVVL